MKASRVRSREAFTRANRVIPGGVNSPARAFGGVGGQPLFIARGEGPYLYDIDGNSYVDYIGSWGPLILGHAHPSVVRAVSDALQDPRATKAVERIFGTKLAGSYLRIEFAQDTDGFWLEPHTDLGVKLFTFLLYLSNDNNHADLGTDIYDADKKHVGCSPFVPNTAMVFVPSNNTYHGFEPRKIEGVRKSVIINYVTNAWRAREQLAFPDLPLPA